MSCLRSQEETTCRPVVPSIQRSVAFDLSGEGEEKVGEVRRVAIGVVGKEAADCDTRRQDNQSDKTESSHKGRLA